MYVDASTYKVRRRKPIGTKTGFNPFINLPPLPPGLFLHVAFRFVSPKEEDFCVRIALGSVIILFFVFFS